MGGGKAVDEWMSQGLEGREERGMNECMIETKKKNIRQMLTIKNV